MKLSRKTITWLVGSVGLVSLLGGCKFFDISNPLLPSSRILAQPNPSMADIKYTWKLTDNTITEEVKETKVNVLSYPGDGTPGLFIHAYSAEYLDQTGHAIPTLTLSKVNFGISQYLPPANNGKQSTIELMLPIVNQQVVMFGEAQVYNFGAQPGRNADLIHTINCQVTLYGEDDNYNEVQTQFNVPIRFSGDIVQ